MGELAYKICIFGESGVGKTTLSYRFLNGYFEEDIKLTMGAEIFVKYLQIEDKRIVLQVWDFGGESKFNFLLPLYSRGSSGGIFMFDLSRKGTLYRIEDWLGCFKRGIRPGEKERPVILVGGKLDLKEHNNVFQKEIDKVKMDYNLFEYIECSSKTGENVEYVFESLVKKILKDFKIL